MLVATLFAARGLAEVERVRILPVLRQPRLRVQYRQAPPGSGWWRRMFTPLGDVQAWLDVLHGVLRFPVSVATFVVVVTWWSGALGGLTYIFWDWALPHTEDNYELPELLGFADTPANRISFYLIMGVVFTLTLPFVVRACALLEAYLGRAMLTGVAELRDQVAGLTQDRATARAQTAAAVSAEATALRRLERDIHDGPQQRLGPPRGRSRPGQAATRRRSRCGPPYGRRGDRADPRGPGRATHPVPRHRPADPH